MAEVGANMQKAFALANVVVALMKKYPRFVDFFNARMVKKCPYTLPYLPKRSSACSEAAHLKSLGYKSEEQEEHYQERMIGCIGLYSAVMQTQYSKAQ
jgi:nucleoporin GLE1